MRLSSIVLMSVAAVFILVAVFTKGWYTNKDKDDFDYYSSYGADDADDYEYGAGLIAQEICRGGECETKDYAGISEVHEGKWFLRFGWITFIVGLITVLMLGLTSLFIGIRHKSASTLGWTTMSLCIAALLSGAMFQSAKPYTMENVEVGYSAILYSLATIAGIVGGALAGRGDGPARPRAPAYRGHRPPYGAPAYGPPPYGPSPYPSQYGHPPYPTQAHVPGGPQTPPPGVPQAPMPTPASGPANTPPPVPACSTCSAPTSWIAQYQRHYCNTCRAYI